jgi:hypothetical protein
MQKHATIETRRSLGFPADVLVALILPAMAIFALIFGPQRMWILFVVVGLVQLSAALSVLRRGSSSAVAWLALAVGIMVVAAGIRVASTLW